VLKQTVSYEDIDGKPRTETIYMNLTEAELAELQFSYEGGFEAHIKSIMDRGDNAALLRTFKELMVKAYGRRGDEGRFVKRAEWAEEFASSEAYSQMFMMLATDPAKAATFFNDIMPKNLSERLEKLKTTVNLPAENVPAVPNFTAPKTDSPFGFTPVEQGPLPVWVTEGRFPTKQELENASPEDMGAWQRSLGR